MMDQADQIFIAWRNVREDKTQSDPDGLLIVGKNRGQRPLNWLGKIQLHMQQSGQFLRQRHDRPTDFVGLPAKFESREHWSQER